MKERDENNQENKKTQNDAEDNSVGQHTSADQGNVTEDPTSIGVGRTAGSTRGSDLTTKKGVTGSDFDGQAI